MQRRGPQAPPFGPVLHWMLCPFRRPAAPASAVRTDPGGAVQQAGKSARQDLEVAPKVDSPTQLAQQIRFGLSTLGENNAHHDFERLCHGLARRRITSNLIPATGPVSSGGDQGRDSESHWTSLPDELPGTYLDLRRPGFGRKGALLHLRGRRRRRVSEWRLVPRRGSRERLKAADDRRHLGRSSTKWRTPRALIDR